jgi:hypothetical protein
MESHASRHELDVLSSRENSCKTSLLGELVAIRSSLGLMMAITLLGVGIKRELLG